MGVSSYTGVNVKNVSRYSATEPFGYEGGTFSDVEVEAALKAGYPLTMDFAIPGKCINNCVFCGYYCVNETGKLTFDEILKVIKEFASLGGKSVKILGEGEPLLREDILGILSYIRELGMVPVLFTGGDVIGDERLSGPIHGISGPVVVEQLRELGVTVVLKYENYYQDDIVGRQGFSEARNRALKLFLQYGLNETFPSKLGLGTVLLKENYMDIEGIYRWCLERNIYQLICPLMPIGKMKDDKERNKLAPSKGDVAVLKGRLKAIRAEFGVSPSIESDFPGGLPCDIARAGFYVDDSGNVFVCESDSKIGNVKHETLIDLWTIADSLKTREYGAARRKGLCFPKRRKGII
ncbi:MAG: radical SAM protein [Candidatus Zixiibacteriota bacterium]|jgi:MoaA/NifB/PqqE/SkfB family radical SAM enzyme